MADTITFTPEQVELLRAAFEEADEAGRATFLFEGHELLTNYVRYLLEYLDGQYDEARR